MPSRHSTVEQLPLGVECFVEPLDPRLRFGDDEAATGPRRMAAIRWCSASRATSRNTALLTPYRSIELHSEPTTEPTFQPLSQMSCSISSATFSVSR
ncbi:hypothetical protein [Streptomyces xiaopingdaonensis]|uniref:hypothetical protein n=1 Tax=Streptomyces xiaopingdaonensis TaxID=1565415 RepID=UPI00037653FE